MSAKIGSLMNTIPVALSNSEKDILKLVNALISNTKGERKSGDEFWTKAETLLYTAYIGYIYYVAPYEEQNFEKLLLNMSLILIP